MKQKHFIDAHKGATPLAVITMMAIYGAWDNVTAWAYLATHGTYGILWVLKSLTFPDKSWERSTGLPYGLFIWGGLSLYWIAPWLITSQNIQAPPWWIGMCVTIYSFGVFFHFASDMQKHVYLSHQKGLITTGLWSRCRNPNYFGELLIYLGFSLLAMHWIPLAALAVFIFAIWVPNMIRKDRSISRYPEFSDYKKKSALIIPFVL